MYGLITYKQFVINIIGIFSTFKKLCYFINNLIVSFQIMVLDNVTNQFLIHIWQQ